MKQFIKFLKVFGFIKEISQKWYFLINIKACKELWNNEVISTTLKACLVVLPVLLILSLREDSQKYYNTFAGVLPEKW